MATVALIGPDGAGKSTIARAVASRLTVPTRYVYMGVNLEASTLMLPTTRLALALKRRKGARPDMVAVNQGPRGADATGGSLRSALRSFTRTANWIAEESFRHAVVRWHEWRGRLVILDRLFLADYHAADVLAVDERRPIASRIHRFFLKNLYPVPDLVILLDAPAEVLHARKPESSVAFLERRRAEYRLLMGVVPRLEIVDVNRPMEAIVRDILELMEPAA